MAAGLGRGGREGGFGAGVGQAAGAAGAHLAVELLIVDADAVLVLAHSDANKGATGVAGAYKRSGSIPCWPT